MSSVLNFATELYQSILTPGVTPVMVKATHASFAALLLVLVGMLIGTKSIHFVVLTFLASGLWAAITWFIAETRKIDAEKKAAEKAAAEKKEGAIENKDAAGEKNEGLEGKVQGESSAVPKPVLTKTGSKKV